MPNETRFAVVRIDNGWSNPYTSVEVNAYTATKAAEWIQREMGGRDRGGWRSGRLTREVCPFAVLDRETGKKWTAHDILLRDLDDVEVPV